MQTEFKGQAIIDLGPVEADRMTPEVIRDHVRLATENFKNSWRNLAQALHVVFQEKLYRDWGYATFDAFTEKEVRIRKHTALKLIRSYTFLKQEQGSDSQYNDNSGSGQTAPASLEAINTLQRAKKSLDDEQYQEVKKNVLKEGKELSQVKKDVAALILKKRKDLDPEQERTRGAKTSVRRFLSTLKGFRREIEVLRVLPGVVGSDIDKLIKKIEGFLPQEAQILDIE